MYVFSKYVCIANECEHNNVYQPVRDSKNTNATINQATTAQSLNLNPSTLMAPSTHSPLASFLFCLLRIILIAVAAHTATNAVTQFTTMATV